MGEPGDLKDGVFVIFAEHDSILLVKHNYGEKRWSLPGGGVREHEIEILAAQREVAEETGITDIPTLRQIGRFTMMKRYGLITLFQALGWFGYPRTDGKEISECKFFTLEELNISKDQIYPAQLKLIRIFLEYMFHPRPVYGKLTDPPEIVFETQ